jgi:hypothetical protein
MVLYPRFDGSFLGSRKLPTRSDVTAADNTKRNSSGENKNADTAEKQSNSKDDLSLTQKIRQA